MSSSDAGLHIDDEASLASSSSDAPGGELLWEEDRRAASFFPEARRASLRSAGPTAGLPEERGVADASALPTSSRRGGLEDEGDVTLRSSGSRCEIASVSSDLTRYEVQTVSDFADRSCSHERTPGAANKFQAPPPLKLPARPSQAPQQVSPRGSARPMSARSMPTSVRSSTGVPLSARSATTQSSSSARSNAWAVRSTKSRHTTQPAGTDDLIRSHLFGLDSGAPCAVRSKSMSGLSSKGPSGTDSASSLSRPASSRQQHKAAECTFRPEILEESRKIASRSLRTKEPRWSTLAQDKAQEREEKRSQARAKLLDEELRGCTFQPEISAVSKQLSRDMKWSSERCTTSKQSLRRSAAADAARSSARPACATPRHSDATQCALGLEESQCTSLGSTRVGAGSAMMDSLKVDASSALPASRRRELNSVRGTSCAAHVERVHKAAAAHAELLVALSPRPLKPSEWSARRTVPMPAGRSSGGGCTTQQVGVGSNHEMHEELHSQLHALVL